MNKKQIMQPSIQVHIQELILHGFDPATRYHVADAVQSELTRLFAHQPVSHALQQGGEARYLNAGSFKVTPTMKADAIGSQVARSVYNSLNPKTKS